MSQNSNHPIYGEVEVMETNVPATLESSLKIQDLISQTFSGTGVAPERIISIPICIECEEATISNGVLKAKKISLLINPKLKD